MKRSLLAVAMVFTLGSYTIPGKSRALRMGAGIADPGAACGQLSGCYVCSVLVYCWSCLNTLPGGSGGPICISECGSCHVMGVYCVIRSKPAGKSGANRPLNPVGNRPFFGVFSERVAGLLERVAGLPETMGDLP
jgi:hypothetical protein